MSNMDKRALREAAERAESDSWGYDRDEFNEALTPSTVLALLDELEAKDSMIAAQRHEIRTLLNALEGRPCPKCNDTGMADSGGTQPWGEPISVPCDCAAPPAPVALPSGYSDFEEIWSSSTHPLTQDDEMKDFAWDIWNACRAAMLQSFGNPEQLEPVTTAYKLPFEQWLSQQTGTIDVECGCVMTEVFFHWLRVAYEAGNSPVIPDGWV
ncbi:ead/Ea22-like family protein, partial [Enterobacter kobei]